MTKTPSGFIPCFTYLPGSLIKTCLNANQLCIKGGISGGTAGTEESVQIRKSLGS